MRYDRPADDGVARVTLQDRAGRNGFSAALCGGLADAVAAAVECADTRVLLVSGLPELFCSGGSRAELMSFARGEGRFDTEDFFRELLNCPLPVVAAMQGHAIGGGLVLGLYADLPVLSERSLYSANFLDYGFTPGMGATRLLPLRLGQVLGQELLYTAARYSGAELRGRGVPLRVVPHAEVPAVAAEMAVEVAGAPRPSLELLKRELAEPLRADSAAAMASEASMHQISFRLPEVAERIVARYGAAPEQVRGEGGQR